MTSRAGPPRILKDVQDITSKLFEEFESSGDPITDDNHVLHRLCVKLEYLLQTCMKEKSSIIGWKKHYWHWMYDSLRRTKGLSDGLKYVRANKDVRTVQGRGRALIRYCLVHQTLADSFQNCIMNQSTCLQYLKHDCILLQQTYSTLFLNALYEINAVNFDLISKGYDLDSAWPTFASKRIPNITNQWGAPAGRTSSLGSLGSYMSHMTSASMVTPQISGLRSDGSVMDGEGPIGSNGPPSVDQRVEELVLELSESDQKIQEQEAAIRRLEHDANTSAKSAIEKQDILARVISDLESRNQTLQEAMSNMTSEYQNRELSWESKHTALQTALKEAEEANSSLHYKISVLEDDKRNLEDTVSARMSLITSGFSGTSVTSISPSTSLDNMDQEHDAQEKVTELEKQRLVLEENVKSLQSELDRALEKAENEKRALDSSLTAKFENKEKEWRCKIQNAVSLATDEIVRQLSTAIPVEYLETPQVLQTSQEQMEYITSKLKGVFEEMRNLRRMSNVTHENLVKSSEEDNAVGTTQMQEEMNLIQEEKTAAITKVKMLTEELVSANEELQNSKLKLEANVSDHQRDMLEMKEVNLRLQEAVDKERLDREKTQEDLRLLKQKYDNDAIELENYKQRCTDLQEQLMESEKENEELALRHKETTELNEHLQEKVDSLEKEAEDEGKLYDECIKENEKLEALATELATKIQNSEASVQAIQTEIVNLRTTVDVLEQEKALLTEELANERTKMSEKLQQAIDSSTAMQSVSEAFDNTEKQYKLLAETLQSKSEGDANFQAEIVKACIEAERSQAKKEYDELSGENESRKRMIVKFEKKIENLEKENADLVKKVTDIEEVKTLCSKERERVEEMTISSRAIEQEFIKIAAKLEEERECSQRLERKISDGVTREQELKREIEDEQSVSNELKAKLIQLVQEKDALWKECDELRFFQKLQEEGEGTEGKWMEDQEARYCLRCGTQFSFITRKHHCRLCGKIFCNDCSKQWIITKTDGKHERCCISCLEIHKSKNEIRALATGSPSTNRKSSQKEEVYPNDTEFDSISDNELNESKDSLHSTLSTANESSVYHTPNAKSKNDNSSENIADLSLEADSLTEDSVDENERETVIRAGEYLRVPVHIQRPGMKLLWHFSTDRSIDFQLSYTNTKDAADEKHVLPRCRCNSQSEPVKGEMEAKKAGFYIFEFDNRFSRLMPKSLKYKFQVVEPGV